MLNLSDPMLAPDAVRDQPANAVADWLTDHEATAADLAVLFAGTGPEHADGIGVDVLMHWLRAHGQTVQADLVRYEKPARWFLESDNGVPHYRFGPTGHGQAWATVEGRLSLPVWLQKKSGLVSEAVAVEEQSLRSAEKELNLLSRAVRDHKRRVLALPWTKNVVVVRRVEIPWTRLCEYDWEEMSRNRTMWTPTVILGQIRASFVLALEKGLLGDLGMRGVDGWTVRVRQRKKAVPTVWATATLTAPQLIFPEPVLIRTDSEREITGVRGLRYRGGQFVPEGDRPVNLPCEQVLDTLGTQPVRALPPLRGGSGTLTINGVAYSIRRWQVLPPRDLSARPLPPEFARPIRSGTIELVAPCEPLSLGQRIACADMGLGTTHTDILQDLGYPVPPDLDERMGGPPL